MKIAIFFDSFFPVINGVITSTLVLAEELNKNGHEIMIFAPSSGKRNEVILPFAEVCLLPSLPTSMVYPDTSLGLFSPKVLKKFMDFNPDVVQITSPVSTCMLGLSLAKMKKVPVVGVFHGYFMEPEYLKVLGISKGVTVFGNLLWSFAKTFYNHCDYIVSPSEYVKNDMLDHGFKLPIYVCRNGFDIKNNSISLDKQRAFEKRFKLDSKQTALYVGRLSKEKNLDTLIKVFQKVTQKLPESKLLIVGDGPIRFELENLVDSLNISKQVMFTGEIGHDEIFEIGLHKLVSLFVTCSTSEVQPMSFIEAMSMGLPLVVAKAKGNTEMVDGNGYVVDPKNLNEFASKIIEVLTNDVSRKKMSSLSKKLSLDYSVQVSFKQYLKVYRDATEKKL